MIRSAASRLQAALGKSEGLQVVTRTSTSHFCPGSKLLKNWAAASRRDRAHARELHIEREGGLRPNIIACSMVAAHPHKPLARNCLHVAGCCCRRCFLTVAVLYLKSICIAPIKLDTRLCYYLHARPPAVSPNLSSCRGIGPEHKLRPERFICREAGDGLPKAGPGIQLIRRTSGAVYSDGRLRHARHKS